jgi:hypothetical protein
MSESICDGCTNFGRKPFGRMTFAKGELSFFVIEIAEKNYYDLYDCRSHNRIVKARVVLSLLDESWANYVAEFNESSRY